MTNTVSAIPFHKMFANRIARLNIMDSSSTMLASQLVEDGQTKVPADKILEISSALFDKMNEVQEAPDGPNVDTVLPMLKQSYDSLQTQIADYRLNGELSDDVDERQLTLDPVITDTKRGMNGAADRHVGTTI